MSSNPYKNEADLIAACAAGDKLAWAEFIQRYRRVIRATAGRLRQRFDHAPVDTDDLEHHVYQKLLENEHRRLTAWRGQAKYSTYLVEVTRNLVLDFYAARARRTNPEEYRMKLAQQRPELQDNPEHPEWAEVRKCALRDALAQLPEKQRVIIQLRLEGKTLAEIAGITHRPLGTIGVENSRALVKLRLAVGEALAKAEGRE